jgi:YggT family protein
MFVVGNVIFGLGVVLDYFFRFYLFVLLGRMIVSWVSADPRNTLVRILVQATDPPLSVIRRMLPRSLRHFPLDIAFLVLVGLTWFLRYAVAVTLMQLGARMSPDLMLR